MDYSNKTKKAFSKVKKDIQLIKAEILRLTKENEMLIEIAKKQTNILVGKTSKTKEKIFVGSVNGGKFHIPKCPYAKNIKPKDKITFKSKNAFLNKGYKPCRCVQ